MTSNVIRNPENESAESHDPRQGHAYIDEADDPALLEWSDHTESEDSNFEDYDDQRVEDEDWENVERDFTKQFNRLRQHVAVRTGNAQGSASVINKHESLATLPAINRPRAPGSAGDGDAKPQQRDKTTDQLTALSKYSSRISKIHTPYLALGVGVNRKGPSATANQKDKSDRATTEQVLDPRTRIILFKMIGRGLIHEINGCVSTGKEANVYHALTPESRHMALKIYKTSILIFKDRDRYVTGEFRFRKGYSRHNPRKMVRLWAEKELRNLRRLVAAGIPCPEPVEVRENVLVMSFLGDSEGWASPRLKDANIPGSSYPSLYAELVLNIRQLFHECKLVHADLSEYNILYHNEHLYIIDVSQSVEHDHPAAFDFLKNDIRNVEEYFGRMGVHGLGLRRCFEFITLASLNGNENKGEDQGAAETDAEVLQRWLSEDVLREMAEDDDTNHDDDRAGLGVDANISTDHEDAVFHKSFIPRTLNEVYDPERDIAVLNRGEGKHLIYAETIGLVEPEQAEKKKQAKVGFAKEALLDDDDDDDDGGGGDHDDDEEEVESDEERDDAPSADDNEQTSGFVERKPRGHRHEDPEAKKERKKLAKEQAREKRKNKMPKAEKKWKIKATSRG